MTAAAFALAGFFGLVLGLLLKSRYEAGRKDADIAARREKDDFILEAQRLHDRLERDDDYARRLRERYTR